MLKSQLYNSTVYRPQLPYVINTFIYEYDLSKANISTLLAQGIINKNKYDELYYANRDERQITIGLMIRENKDVGNAIKNGIRDAKRMLFDANNIEDWEVLTIKNDAVFIIGRELEYTEFEHYKFVKKNIYTIFLQLNEYEIYYYDRFDLNGELDINIDVKGLNDNLLPLHEHGILELICYVCFELQRGSISDLLSYVSKLYEDYIFRRLPLDYYREFNFKSKYAIISRFSIFYFDHISEKHIEYLDINCNLLLIRTLIQIISSIYHIITK